MAKLEMEETLYETCFCVGRTAGISTLGIEGRRETERYWRNKIDHKENDYFYTGYSEERIL